MLIRRAGCVCKIILQPKHLPIRAIIVAIDGLRLKMVLQICIKVIIRVSYIIYTYLLYFINYFADQFCYFCVLDII